MDKYKNLKSYTTDTVAEKKIFIENSMVLPDFKPDIKNALLTKPKCKVNQSKAIKDKVHFSGCAEAKIIYATGDEDNPVSQLKWHEDFREQIVLKDIIEATEIMDTVESVEVQIINERKVLIRMVINIQILGHKKDDVKVLCDKDEDMEILSKTIDYEHEQYIGNYMGEVRDFFTIRKENNDIYELINVSGNAKVDNVNSRDDKVLIGGKMLLDILYSTDDPRSPLKSKAHEFDFSHIIENMSVPQNESPDATVKIDSIIVDTELGDNGNMTITLTINIEGKVSGLSKETLEIVKDTYSSKYKISPNISTLEYTSKADEFDAEIFAKENVQLQANMPNIYKVCHIDIEPKDFFIVERDGESVMQGDVLVNSIYISDDETMDLYSTSSRVGVERVLPTDMNLSEKTTKIDVTAYNASCEDYSGRDMNVKFKLDSMVKVYDNIKENVISDIKRGDKLSADKPTVAVYFTNLDDSLWKVGKKYNIKVDRLKELNETEKGMPRYLIIR